MPVGTRRGAQLHFAAVHDGGTAGYANVSFWMEALGPIEARSPLPGDGEVDVAVVGAGYTGLWTAYYLLRADPSLSVAVLEKEVAGFGASGRNGGWCSAFFAASDCRIARQSGREAMEAMRTAMNATVDEVGRVTAEEGIDCHFRKAGTISVARSSAQLKSMLGELGDARRLGVGEEELVFLEKPEASARMAASGVLGGLYRPQCAALQPARLVRGLAEAVERRGAKIYERTRVLEVVPGSRSIVRTSRGQLGAGMVVIATEGYTSDLAGHRRDCVPIYSLMVATEPLGAERVSSLGSALESGATFSDGRHLIVYGQVTADERIAFGGRGAPYHFGSRVEPAYDRDPAVHDGLRAAVGELFPQLGSFTVTHRWGGAIGVHRDWYPSVSIDRRLRIAAAGGYVGDGVGTANLAGRTLADLITERPSHLTTLPWVGHESRSWEPEPFRYIGVNGALRATELADRIEERTGRPSRLAGLVGRLTGH